jgi:[ribosomal protein S5]-alanine N-acetyltransferase
VGVIRPFLPEDVHQLVRLRIANRTFLEPFDPLRPDTFFTIEGQRAWLASGNGLRFGIVEDDAIAGTISLSEIIRGPLQSAIVGYWVDQRRNGRGLASRALAAVLDVAFGELDLHRVEAGTLLDNVASQRVLEHNGFTRIGVARKHLLLGGEWRDHLIFERLVDD